MIRRCLITAVLAAALIGTTAVPAEAAPTSPPQPSSSQVRTWQPFERDARLLSLEGADRAQPAGWWGWTQCLGTVAAWAASNAFIAAKIATLVKKAGSLRRAIQKAQAKVGQYPKSKKRWTAIALIGGVGTEISGVGAVVAACF